MFISQHCLIFQGKSRASESKRLSKLPPRLAKQREQKEREKKESKQQPSTPTPTDSFMPKIEDWDNEMANNIPISDEVATPTKPPTTQASQG